MGKKFPVQGSQLVETRKKNAGWGPWTRYRKTARSLWYIDKQVPPPPLEKKIRRGGGSTQATGNVETLARLANNEERTRRPSPITRDYPPWEGDCHRPSSDLQCCPNWHVSRINTISMWPVWFYYLYRAEMLWPAPFLIWSPSLLYLDRPALHHTW